MVKSIRYFLLAPLLGVVATNAMANSVTLKNMSGLEMPVMYEVVCHHPGTPLTHLSHVETVIPPHGFVDAPVNVGGQTCQQAGVVVQAIGATGTETAPTEEPVAPAPSGCDPMLDPACEPAPVCDPAIDPACEEEPAPPMCDPMVDPNCDPTVPASEDPTVVEYPVTAQWHFLPAEATQFGQSAGCWADVFGGDVHATISLFAAIDQTHAYVGCHTN